MKISSNNKQEAIIVSDLHIGSKFFFNKQFINFLQNIPGSCDLILNGDIIDNPYAKLKAPHQQVLDIIEKISHHRKIIWISGNHDNGYIPEGLEKIHFKNQYNIGHRLLVVHGDNFDEIMPKNQVFMKAFKMMHDLRVKLGAKPVHVAQYAKKWNLFYKVLRKNVMINAVKCALENGYKAVTCGHTHYPEDKFINGIRYINTGAWTEYPAYYLLVTDNKKILRKAVD